MEQAITSRFANHSNNLNALRSLSENAAEIVCKNCTFYDKSPVEVATLRAQQARAEADYITALAIRADAMKQLGSVDPAYRDSEVTRVFENFPIPSDATLPSLPEDMQLR